MAPGTRNFTIGRLEIDGEPARRRELELRLRQQVQPSYFATMGIAFVEGATFADTTNAHAVIVNACSRGSTVARAGAIGKRIRIVQRGNRTLADDRRRRCATR